MRATCSPLVPHSRVPVLFGDPVQAGKHDWQDDAGVLLDQAHDVLVVPVVQRSLCNLTHPHTTVICLPQACAMGDSVNPKGGVTDLKVWAGDTSGDLFEEGLLDLDKLCGLNNVQDFLQLPQKHHLQGNTTGVTNQDGTGAQRGGVGKPHLFLTAGFWPELQ